jgi:hypothetical protein
MLIRFREDVALPVADVYPYFQSPVDWVRLYGIAGAVEHRGDGWYAVPLRASLSTGRADHQNGTGSARALGVSRLLAWRGRGVPPQSLGGTLIEGYELIAVRWLFLLSPWLRNSSSSASSVAFGHQAGAACALRRWRRLGSLCLAFDGLREGGYLDVGLSLKRSLPRRQR